MGTVRRFEDLIAWQKARVFARDIYQLTFTRPLSSDFGFRDQLRNSALSIASNIAEGFERGSRAEFRRFLLIAKASCAETRTQLYIASDIGYITAETLTTFLGRGEEIARVIGGLIVSVSRGPATRSSSLIAHCSCSQKT